VILSFRHATGAYPVAVGPDGPALTKELTAWMKGGLGGKKARPRQKSIHYPVTSYEVCFCSILPFRMVVFFSLFFLLLFFSLFFFF
jgi:hypothetical protein